MSSTADKIRDEFNTTDDDLSEAVDDIKEAKEREKNSRDKMGSNSNPKNDVKVIELNLEEVRDISQKITRIANEIGEEVQDIRNEEEMVQEDINKSEQKIRDKISTERLLEYFNLLLDANPNEKRKKSRAHEDDTWEKDTQAEYSREEAKADHVTNRLVEYKDYIDWSQNNIPEEYENGIGLTPDNINNISFYLNEVGDENMRWATRLDNYINFLNSRFVEDVELEEEELPSQIETLLGEFKKLKKETDFLEKLEEELEKEEKFEQKKIEEEIVPGQGEIKPVIAKEKKETKRLSKEIRKIYEEEERIINQLKQVSKGWQEIHENEISFLEQELANLEECSTKIRKARHKLRKTAPANSGGKLEAAEKHAFESLGTLGHIMNRLANVLQSIVGDSKQKYEHFEQDLIPEDITADSPAEAFGKMLENDKRSKWGDNWV